MELPDSLNPERIYKVFVLDNFHYMDEDAGYEYGEFATCEDATAACREIVDSYLIDAWKPGMDADTLLKLYRGFGDDPVVTGGDALCAFSAWEYARLRSIELCRQGTDGTADDAPS